MLRLEFCILRGIEDSEEVEEINDVVEKVRQKLKITIKKFIDEKGEDNLKYQILWSISIAKRTKIKQKRKSKSLCLKSIVFGSDEPKPFIHFRRFIKGEIKCLHEKFEMKGN